jgi:hypothetical protein
MIAQAVAVKTLQFSSLMAAVKHAFYEGTGISLLAFKEEYKKLTDTDRAEIKADLEKIGYTITGPMTVTSNLPMVVQSALPIIPKMEEKDPLALPPQVDDESIHAGYTVGDEHPAVKAA